MRCHAWAALIITLLNRSFARADEEGGNTRVPSPSLSSKWDNTCTNHEGMGIERHRDALPNVHREIPENLIYKYLAF